MTRRLPYAGAALLLVPAMAACGGSSDTSATGTSTSTAASASSSSAPTTESSTEQSPRTVRYGETAKVMYSNDIGGDEFPIAVTISVKKGSAADLKAFQLDAADKKKTPYYVSYRLKNVSTKTFDSAGYAGRLTANATDDSEIGRLTLIGTFSKCQGDPPKKLKPGATAKGCQVYFADRGKGLASVATGIGDGEVTWK